ncbi:MAG: hypothetical protein JO335_09050 [Sphingomonas sp.]|nr:hypothetical protein [Sphingomonas sp.]
MIALLVLPGALGLYLVVDAVPDGSFLQIAIGLALLAFTPFYARRTVRAMELRKRDDL